MKCDLENIHVTIISRDRGTNETKIPDLEHFVITLEDRRFFKHCGFDWRAIAAGAVDAVRKKRLRGASTIEQQLVRTVTGRRELTLRRKIREIVLAWMISRTHEKIDILRAYLRCGYFGEGRAFTDLPAQLFNKDFASLSPSEFAIIAALLKYPIPKIYSTQWKMKVARRARYAVLKSSLDDWTSTISKSRN